jgi:hypothetical protein
MAYKYNTMRYLFYLLVIMGSLLTATAQTGIGTTTPNASAKLDVYATNKGFLPPRVTLTSATDASTIVSPAEGLLVYNVGSVGLQAGYYYWNGASWATIATANAAGNGVTASDLVKLYNKVYSTASGDIAHANGYTFTVPVSGKYLFDFSSSGYVNQTSFTMTFSVRQGTSVLASDFQTSANNNVHVEYNGKLEVNLQAGTSYNVYVNSTGSRDAGDYDRVYYKLVSGNLPVTGQSVDYALASLSANQSLSAAGNILFNTISGTGITLSSGGFNLIANKTYKLEAALGGTSGGYAYYAWVDNTNNVLPGGSIGVIMKAGSAFTDAPQDKAVVFYTPTTNTTIYLRVLNVSGGVVAFAPPAANNYSSTWATISQIGSSAFVNPWILSGNNVYNTTGKVGIGTNAPTQTLDVTGNVNVTGKINLTDPSGNVLVKAAAFANAGVAVTLGDIQVQMSTGGARSLQIRTTGSSFTGMVSAYTSYSNSAFTHFADVTQTITGTFAYIGTAWGFATDGDLANYFVRDTTNQRFYRITLMVGPSYFNNFISIERLL